MNHLSVSSIGIIRLVDWKMFAVESRKQLELRNSLALLEELDDAASRFILLPPPPGAPARMLIEVSKNGKEAPSSNLHTFCCARIFKVKLTLAGSTRVILKRRAPINFREKAKRSWR
jgi:hypothetical protein